MDEKLTNEIRVAPALQVKRAPENGVVAGYASTFDGVPDAYGDLIRKGAFATSLAEHQAAGTMPSFLWSHRPDTPIGRLTTVREDDVGLWIEAQINRQTTAGKDAYESIKARDCTGLSIGYQTRARDGAALTDVALHEVSAVTMPANSRARVTQVKSLEGRDHVETILLEAGVARAAAKKLASGGWPALVGDADRDCDYCMRTQVKVLTSDPHGTRICQQCAEQAARLFQDPSEVELKSALQASIARWQRK